MKVEYEALYNWYAVNSGKLAPDGWHIPSDSEWTILEDFLADNGFNFDSTKYNRYAKSVAAKTDWQLSSVTGSIGNDLTKNNTTGFSALPGGSRLEDGSFDTCFYQRGE